MTDPTPIAELLAAVPSLDDPTQPFTYAVEGNKIVGRWDIVRATSLYPTAVEHVDKKYQLIVELDEDEHTYDFDEKKTSSHVEVDGGGLHFGTEGFKGKSTSKEFSFEFGGVTSHRRAGPTRASR